MSPLRPLEQVGVGVIGVGVMGGAHARLLTLETGGARVVAVHDAHRAGAESIAAEVGAEVCQSAHDLMARDDVHAVLVAAPDPLHEELVLACLDAGKPVLCEKPLSVTSEGTGRIAAREQELGRRLVQVGFMRRFDPGFVALREALRRGEVGTPRVVHCRHRNAAAHPSATSAGVISNSMIHELDHVPWLLDDPLTAITVHASRAGRTEGDLLDNQVAILETASGVVATVEVSVNARYGYDVACEVLGESGSARLSPPYGVALRRDARDGIVVEDDFVGRFAEAYRVELAAWVGAVRSGKPLGPSAWDGHLATLAAEAGVRSLEGAGRVEIATPPVPQLYR